MTSNDMWWQLTVSLGQCPPVMMIVVTGGVPSLWATITAWLLHIPGGHFDEIQIQIQMHTHIHTNTTTNTDPASPCNNHRLATANPRRSFRWNTKKCQYKYKNIHKCILIQIQIQIQRIWATITAWLLHNPGGHFDTVKYITLHLLFDTVAPKV